MKKYHMNVGHKPGVCRCDTCTYGKDYTDKVKKEAMQKYGFYCQLVEWDPAMPNNTNFHTHGLPRSWGHPDIQICFPMKGEVAGDIFHNCVEQIKKGVVFEVGIKYSDILGNGYQCEFIEAIETGRPVLRLLVPNADHAFSGKIYTDQFLT